MNLFRFNKERLTYERIHFKTYIKCIGVLGLAFGAGWVSSTNKTINKIIHLSSPEVVVNQDEEPFSEDALIELLKSCNMKFPHIVLAQAKLESYNFKSGLFKHNNNMFGMRKARQRITAAQNEKNTYAYYASWKECIYDYAMYQSTVLCSVSNEDEYFAKLSERKYAEDTLYISKIKGLIKKEKLKSIFEE